MISTTAMASINLKAVHFMKDIGLMGRQKEKEQVSINLEISMLVNSIAIKGMEKG